MYAAHSDRLKAGVAWYGRLVTPANDMAPTNPIDVAGKLISERMDDAKHRALAEQFVKGLPVPGSNPSTRA
jgi:F-type H+-transporting ATPase subunit b